MIFIYIYINIAQKIFAPSARDIFVYPARGVCGGAAPRRAAPTPSGMARWTLVGGLSLIHFFREIHTLFFEGLNGRSGFVSVWSNDSFPWDDYVTSQ